MLKCDVRGCPEDGRRGTKLGNYTFSVCDYHHMEAVDIFLADVKMVLEAHENNIRTLLTLPLKSEKEDDEGETDDPSDEKKDE